MAHSNSASSTGESPSPVVLKRKRTARHRALPPHPSAAAASSASSDANEEEEDMANCLILLAQGQAFPANEAARAAAAPSGAAAAPSGGSDFFLFECKTCNKCFPSFQALGGHRASHKKPKTAASETEIASSVTKPAASSSSAGGKQRTHECSVCGSDFPSGQALGGHMRRHRPAAILENSVESDKKKEKRVLLLDLNLPAPNDDDFAAKPLVFPSLVGCHY